MDHTQSVLMLRPADNNVFGQPVALSGEEQMKIAKKMAKKEEKMRKKAAKKAAKGQVADQCYGSVARDAYGGSQEGYIAAYEQKLQEKIRKKAEKRAKKAMEADSMEKSASKAWKHQQKLEETRAQIAVAQRSLGSGQPLTEKEMKKLAKQNKKVAKLEGKVQRETSVLHSSEAVSPYAAMGVASAAPETTESRTEGMAFEQPFLYPSMHGSMGGMHTSLAQPTAPYQQEPMIQQAMYPSHGNQQLSFPDLAQPQPYALSLSAPQPLPPAQQYQQPTVQQAPQQCHQYQPSAPSFQHQLTEPQPYSSGTYAY